MPTRHKDHEELLHWSVIRLLNIGSFQADIVSGLVANLKNFIPHLYSMYEALEARAEPPLLLELEIAQGKRRLDDPDVVKYFSAMPASCTSDALPVSAFCVRLIHMLKTLQAPYDKEKWEEYLVKFMVIADLPFTFVEIPEFREFVQYTRGPAAIHIPSTDTIKRRVVALSEKTIEELKGFFRVKHFSIRLHA
jgi:hypothetical protein